MVVTDVIVELSPSTAGIDREQEDIYERVFEHRITVLTFNSNSLQDGS